jgi:predicted Zn-dependent protease with MMP-like domain
VEDDGFDEFAALVESAIARIPSPFAERLDTVAIVVDDAPTVEQLRRLRVPGLFGLYEGVPRTAYRADWAQRPSKITIFRNPIERSYPDPEARARAVEATVFHEIAHHFGIGEDRLRELEASQRRRRGRR